MFKRLITARKYADYGYTVELDRIDNKYVTIVHYANSEIEIYPHNDYERAVATFYAVCESNGMTEIVDCDGNKFFNAPVLEKIGA